MNQTVHFIFLIFLAEKLRSLSQGRVNLRKFWSKKASLGVVRAATP